MDRSYVMLLEATTKFRQQGLYENEIGGGEKGGVER